MGNLAGLETASRTGDLPTGQGVAHPARTTLAWRPVLAVVAVAGIAHLAVLTRFGWHRDELYYVVCGHHLAFGYPDQPPLAPLIARLASGGGLAGLRLVAVFAQLGCIVAGAVLAAELGGRRRAQLIAAAAVAGCPIFVGASLLFGTTVLDQLVWAVVLVLVARALRTGRQGTWVPVGVACGIGLETKQTVVVLMAGVLAGLVLDHRDVLRTPGPWLAGAIAAALWLPNVGWDATHGWANLQMAASLARKQGGTLGSAAQLPLLALLLAGPLLVVLWIKGAGWLLADPTGRSHRWLAVVGGVAVVAFTAGGGKPYYAAPALIGLFAAGAVSIERGTAGRRLRLRGWPTTLVLSAISANLIALPFASTHVASTLRPIDQEVVETYGWPQFTAQVAAAARDLPAGTVVFTSNYGEAGAFARFGPGLGLHLPIASAHNAYGFWGPPAESDQLVLAVGEFDATYLRQFWSQVTEVAPLRLRDINDEESTSDAAIYLCRAPRGTWAALWPRLRHLD